ncbi:MAG: ferrochelatase [Pseudomonadales bacterium]|nr:ferrochelatase [Pseudomonadales bacterium]MCP5166895.1 ferrochelatase [Pseudomonadales bacterium]MCP5188155.1 ferrochelatase [Pseudomonadales bacterium]
MKFIGSPNFDHSQPPRVGVLITNLGTPEAPEKGALRRYLGQFLWDPRVVEIPRLLWWLILHGIILRLRPSRSAAAYRQIWTDRGSPLMVNTQDQALALRRHLQARHGDRVLVEFAMRYGQPDIASTVQGMLDRGVDKLVVLPLYPQYSGPTTGSTFDALAADLGRRRWVPQLRFVAQYHDHPAYIEALAQSILAYRKVHGSADKLVFSYHGEPRRCLDLGDPYFCQCHKTTRLVVEHLGLAEDAYLTTFQSRFGKAEWLQPYTDATLKSLPGSGVKSVQVICPGFSADCLETLEEIGVENRDYFLQAGGERYEYIPCLNSDAEHITALAAVLEDNLQGWLEDRRNPDATQARAKALGAAR